MVTDIFFVLPSVYCELCTNNSFLSKMNMFEYILKRLLPTGAQVLTQDAQNEFFIQ